MAGKTMRVAVHSAFALDGEIVSPSAPGAKSPKVVEINARLARDLIRRGKVAEAAAAPKGTKAAKAAGDTEAKEGEE